MKKILLSLFSIVAVFSLYADDAWVPPLLSLILPGAGQIYNGDYVKAGVIIAAEAVLGYMVYEKYSNESDDKNVYRDLLSAAIMYSVLDAYVSKELKISEDVEGKSDTLQTK